MTSVLLRRGEDTQMEEGHMKMRSLHPPSGDWSDTVASQGMAGTAGSHQMLEEARKDSSFQASEGAWP